MSPQVFLMLAPLRMVKQGRRMLMIYQPSGFDEYLAELATMSDADCANEQKMTALNERYDIINLGPLPAGQPSA